MNDSSVLAVSNNIWDFIIVAMLGASAKYDIGIIIRDDIIKMNGFIVK